LTFLVELYGILNRLVMDFAYELYDTDEMYIYEHHVLIPQNFGAWLMLHNVPDLLVYLLKLSYNTSLKHDGI